MTVRSDHHEQTAAALPPSLVGSIVLLSPTTALRWMRCRRQYLLRNVLQMPSLDTGPAAEEGLKVHALLRMLHERGSCTDRAWVDEVVDSYGVGDADRLRGFLERHARRCPQGAVAHGHEVELARFHRSPPPLFLVAGTIDAIWVHDGILDARDYKTGTPWTGDVSDDVRARVQAWLLAPLARERGLRLRVRYEFLAPEVAEDPPPFEPEPDRLDEIEEELRTVSEAMRTEREFVGVGDPRVCRSCDYRSVCLDARVGDGP